jgi:hypothetical protein
LRAVQPIVIKYTTGTKISASHDVMSLFYGSLHSLSTGYIGVQVYFLPNFEPNDYFWKHHWQEDKEEKWEAFARVAR